jgi:cytochrome d ubiquinol oxidase subunit II
MIDFSSSLDLPLIFGFIIAGVIFLYVLLDGFDLGIGIILPFAPSEKCRNRMLNSIAPFWDGNETWLVLGGAGLFGAFPLAYSIILPAFYIPITIMLLGLIMRGVAFEFRFKSTGSARHFWGYVFHFGSLAATFFQGVMLGAFVQGIKVEGRNFSGSAFDWANSFSLMVGVALVFGYALLGSTWLIMKTEDVTQEWSRKVATYALYLVVIFMALVTAIMPLLNIEIKMLWFSAPNIFYLLPIPFLTIFSIVALWLKLRNQQSERAAFFLSIAIFLLCYLGIALSLFPWIVPFRYSIWEAAASAPSLSLLLIGVSIILPVILCYTAYSYYVFRGKTNHANLY